ncbi:hypothetical protein OG413_18340 [Streptomyces sp. NBC_01433]|uniref:hypothetical protein n=1 Tax=Streptomyces sp. NBC_01433 TaxID=2903864 RepID=UPI002250A5E5|nr:hypothetical protein [Streptomyces sp. NBC_01433]MCX4677236.1 hypothetical protein [Streptomyces sp. NBC_01433]
MTRDWLTADPVITMALCVRCKTVTYAPVPIRYMQSTSGPGTTLYACPAHAVALVTGPVPGELEPGM